MSRKQTDPCVTRRDRTRRPSLAYRVAFPAWRLVGIQTQLKPEPDEKLSRNEIEDLFSDVLHRNRSCQIRVRETRADANLRAALIA